MRGGGNFITQSAPTNFHQFFTRKVLTESENIEDFREVTASEKAAIKANDAKWEAPKEWEIQKWEEYACVNNVRYGRYNPDTGFFELNGITDIGYKEARIILAAAPLSRMWTGDNFAISMFYSNNNRMTEARTCMPIYHNNLGGATGNSISFSFWGKLEVLQFCANNYLSLSSAFRHSGRLKRILGLNAGCDKANALKEAFMGCSSLETAEVNNLKQDVSFADSPLLSAESVEYMVRHRRVNGASAQIVFTITLHPTAYARVTDELFALAAEKNITIATT